MSIDPGQVPFWDGEDQSFGYAWNPTGTGGTNHFGSYVGLTNVSHGVGAYGAYGAGAHFFRTWQRTNIRGEEGDTIILSWDINFLSADYSGGWFNAALQFVTVNQIVADFPHNVHTEPQDVWLTHSITQVVTAAQAGTEIQIQLNGAGVWVDNVRLEVVQANKPANELIYNGSFELPFVDGYGQPYDPAVPDSIGYGGQPTFKLPGWNGEVNWGYAWNPTGSGGTNHWYNPAAPNPMCYVGLTNVSDGAGAYGAWGEIGHFFSTWQSTETFVEEGDTVIMSWDMNFLYADYGSNAWHDAHLQFVKWDTNGVPYAYPGHQIDIVFEEASGNVGPFDVWRSHSITQTVTAAQSGAMLQVHFEGAGMFIDNVSVLHISGKNYAGWIAGYGLAGPDAEPDYDFEPDGIINMDEYAFGGDPTNPDNPDTLLPASELSGATWTYVYRRRRDAAARNLVYDLSYTNNLMLPWADANVYETSAGDIDANFESVTNEIPAVDPEGFGST